MHQVYIPNSLDQTMSIKGVSPGDINTIGIETEACSDGINCGNKTGLRVDEVSGDFIRLRLHDENDAFLNVY